MLPYQDIAHSVLFHHRRLEAFASINSINRLPKSFTELLENWSIGASACQGQGDMYGGVV